MENLLSSAQLAEKLNVHKYTIHRMANDGRIPCVKLGKTDFRFDLKKVMAALEETNNNDED
tara:strand:- start:708 stop:890 length:183 start_codon:yes stop_codon:yes gene_type:complete